MQKTIDQKIEWLVKIGKAMANLKGNVERIQFACRYGHSPSIEEQNKSRLEERIKVLNATMGSQHIFNEDVINGSRKYLIFDASIPDVCAKSINGEIEWRKILIEVNDIMGLAIRRDQQKLNEINSISKK